MSEPLWCDDCNSIPPIDDMAQCQQCGEWLCIDCRKDHAKVCTRVYEVEAEPYLGDMDNDNQSSR